jgi:hypothetical protein
MGDCGCRSIFCRRPCSCCEWFLRARDAGPCRQRKQSNSDCSEDLHRVLTSHFLDYLKRGFRCGLPLIYPPQIESVSPGQSNSSPNCRWIIPRVPVIPNSCTEGITEEFTKGKKYARTCKLGSEKFASSCNISSFVFHRSLTLHRPTILPEADPSPTGFREPWIRAAHD